MAVRYSYTAPVAGAARNTGDTEVVRHTDYGDTFAAINTRIAAYETNGLDTADIGVTVQGYDADLAALAAIAGVQGDVIYHNGTSWTRLAKGTAAQVLAMNAGATAPEWTAAGAGGGVTFSHNTWTPTVAATTGTITTSSATGRYSLLDDRVFFNLDVTITTNGTGAGSVTATLPFSILTGNAYIFVGREDGATGAMIQGKATGASSTLTIFKYDNTYPGGDGNVLRIAGQYRKAP